MTRWLAALVAAWALSGAPAATAQMAVVGAPLAEDAMPAAPSVEERLVEIRRRIQAALVYPRIARRSGLTGVTLVRFEIDRRGAPYDVELAHSSGHGILDRAARRSVDRAGALPWVHGRIEVPIRFALDDPT